MIYLIDTRNGKEQLLKLPDTQYYSRDWQEVVNHGEVWFGEAAAANRVVVMTYAKFGVLAERYPSFGYSFELMIGDEIHMISHSEKYGWSITEPSENLIDFIIANDLKDILINRNEGCGMRVTGTGTHSGTGSGAAKPSSSRKYRCPCCGNSVRATKSVRIACLDCNVPMIEA